MKSRRRVSGVVAALLLGAPASTIGSPAATSPTPRFASVIEPREWSFPDDHGAHREYQTEWWYYTGHLAAENGRRFGYELVFFRHTLDPGSLTPVFSDWQPAELYPAHFAITDEGGRRFFFRERLERGFGGRAGADSLDLDVWCGDWSAVRNGSAHRLRAAADGWEISLELVPLKPPVLHGNGGLSRKGPEKDQASHYYSLTRMSTNGLLNHGDESWNVSGTSWMDHEFFSSPLDTTLTGWDWFSLQLDDGSEIMLYRLRGRIPANDWPSGTFVKPDGTALSLKRGDFSIKSSDTWKSPATGVTYPSRWTLTIPPADLAVEVVPTLPDQELDTRSSTGVVYWEGSVTVLGRKGNDRLTGRGYVELTGYGGMSPFNRRPGSAGDEPMPSRSDKSNK